MRTAILGLTLASLAAAATNSAPVTYYKNVLPVLQKNCQGCHRPGEAAPMSFLTYDSTRPWAKAMKQAVLSKKMPPWFADPHYGKFANDRTMSQSEIDTLVAWVDSGAKAGDPKEAPKPVEFLEGWNIGRPDAVFQMPVPIDVPASGTVDYQYMIVPTNFTEDKWVQMAEVRPGNRAVLHHVIAFIREPGSKWFADQKPGVVFVPDRKKGQGGQGEFLVGYAPGAPPEMLREGRAKLVKAGSDVVFQLHYTANGKPGSDQSSIGLMFAKEPVTERVMTAAVANEKFVIPPGAASHAVEAKMTIQEDGGTMLTLLPHMHLRGKAMTYKVTYPTGESETLLSVPNYSFSWQLWYEFKEPKKLPKGTIIKVVGVFDNSANNPSNPDPTKEVKWGDQGWEEMMIGFFDIAFDVKMNPADLFRPKKQQGQQQKSGAE